MFAGDEAAAVIYEMRENKALTTQVSQYHNDHMATYSAALKKENGEWKLLMAQRSLGLPFKESSSFLDSSLGLRFNSNVGARGREEDYQRQRGQESTELEQSVKDAIITRVKNYPT